MRPFLVLSAFLLALPASALKVERMGGVRTAAGGVEGGVEVVAGEALVKFDAAMTLAQREAALATRGAGYVAEVASTGWTHVTLPAGISVEAGLPILRALPGALVVQPNHAYRPSKAPNDINFWTQYHLDKINAPQAWDDEDGSSNKVTIAVLDAGVEGSHPELAGKFVGPSQFCDPGPNKNIGGDDAACVAEPSGAAVAACNHGTRVSGTALASTNNNTLGAGVSWGAQLVSLRTFRTGDCTTACGDAAGQACATDDTATANAIDYARTVLNANAGLYGRVVVNASIGGPAASCVGVTVLDTAIDQAVAAGVVFIAASGNSGGAVNSPGNCDNAIPVGATNSKDALASFSSRGAELANNGVVAPGVGIITTDLGGKITTPGDAANGTSFSAPIVSGLAALLLAELPALTVAQVKAHIRNGAETIGEVPNNQGAGRVNACRSMKLALGQAANLCVSGASNLAGFAKAEQVVAFPNPLRMTDVTGAVIKIPSDMQATSPLVRIYTLDGVLIRTVTTAANAAIWDGKNDSGHAVASGVYLVAVGTGSGVRKTKLAVIR